MVSRTDDPERRERGAADLLLALAILVGLVRFLRLGDFGLWYDEVLTWGDAHRIGAVDGPDGPRNLAGYAIVRATVALLGHGPTEGALRFAPALAGWLAVPLTAFAFRPIAGALRANLAALVVALSAFQVQWSQTARFYTFAEVLVLLGTGLLLRGVFHRERRSGAAENGPRSAPEDPSAALGPSRRGSSAARVGLIALAVALGLASMLFHVSGLVACAATVLALGPELLRRRRRGAFLAGGLVLAALAAFAFVRPLWLEYARHKAVGAPLAGLRHFGLSLASSVTPGLAVAGLAALVVGRFPRDAGLRITVAVCAFGVAALGVLASQVTVSAYYAFALFPWFALLAAWPVGNPELAARVRAGWGVLVALPLVAPLMLYFVVENGQRPRWREAAAFVDARRRPTDVVAAIPEAVLEFYLSGGRETNTRSAHAVERIDSFSPRAAIELARTGRTVWYVVRRDYLQRFQRDDLARLQDFFAEECHRVATFPVLVSGRDLAIEVWRYGE